MKKPPTIPELGGRKKHLLKGDSSISRYRNRAAKSKRRRKRLCGSARMQRVGRGRWKPVPITQAYSAKSGTGSISTSSNLSEHAFDEIAEHLPKCYSYEIQGGEQCSSAPPGEPEDPFYSLF
jgi:hypothetical protein